MPRKPDLNALAAEAHEQTKHLPDEQALPIAYKRLAQAVAKTLPFYKHVPRIVRKKIVEAAEAQARVDLEHKLIGETLPSIESQAGGKLVKISIGESLSELLKMVRKARKNPHKFGLDMAIGQLKTTLKKYAGRAANSHFKKAFLEVLDHYSKLRAP